MFRKRFKKQTKLDKEIDNLLEDMSKVDRKPEIKPTTDKDGNKIYKTIDQYTPMVENLERLCKARSVENSSKRDLVKAGLFVGGNLLGVAWILKREDFHVITSKAMGYLFRGRV